MNNEMLKQKNLLFELHESEFIGFTIKDSDLIFRVAINCGVEEKLGVKSDFAEKFYIYDMICHKYKILCARNYSPNFCRISATLSSFSQVNNSTSRSKVCPLSTNTFFTTSLVRPICP